MSRHRATDRNESVWVLSELYHPELTSTGHYMTLIAERLARHRRVRALCGQPTYGAHGRRAPTREVRNGVSITRCRATAFHKDRFVGRVLNAVTLTVSIFLSAVLRVRRGDLVIVVTNPPSLPFVAALACRARGARLVVLIHDRYPELLVAVGALPASSPVVRLAGSAQRWLLRGAFGVVVIGRDVKDAVVDLGVPADRVEVITNWADVAQVVPVAASNSALRQELGLVDRPVAVYAGNFGRANDVDSLVDAAGHLGLTTEIAVVLIGDGPRRRWVERQRDELSLTNLRVAGPFPRADQSDLLAVGDVVVIPMVAGITGVSVPSRMYNAFAAGKPVIAAIEPESELARTIVEEGVGWVVPTGNASLLASTIASALAGGELEAMGLRARDLAVRRFAVDIVLDRWNEYVVSLDAMRRTPRSPGSWPR
ncbi:MAG: glycosyltransferase family 4 protein [Aquihabitans sp.]